MRLIIITLTLLSLQLAGGPASAGNFGKFKGRLITTWGDDGRKMILEETFSYIDPRTKIWKVPKGTTVDGASIPWAMWSIIGGPFAGKYRRASVIHDYFCDLRSRPWKQVHRVFFNAMLAAGVEERKAKIMYAAVYHFGPRWTSGLSRISGGPSQQEANFVATPVFSQEAFDRLIDKVSTENPSLAAIENLQ